MGSSLGMGLRVVVGDQGGRHRTVVKVRGGLGGRLWLGWQWVCRGGPWRLTSVAQQELVEVPQPLQAGALGGPVGVLAQKRQQAHQPPDVFVVLLWLW